MTSHKHLKALVRARMAKTGESYATARRHIVQQAPEQPAEFPFIHYPGIVPGATALRVLSANAGVINPHTGRPLSEAMAFGIGGGIGAGVFAFHYAKEDFSSFFIAGRHLWQDEKSYLEQGFSRMGLRPQVKESGGAKAGLAALQAGLQHGPVVAWVDAAHLPYRALPAYFSGGGYHIVVVYQVDGSSALLGDLADTPFTVSLDVLAAARGRIKKDKQRILAVEKSQKLDLKQAIFEGLRACHAGLTGSRQANFNLKAFSDWGDRLYGSKARESWDQVFPLGHRLWQGLRSIHEYIEHYGTGGGLQRPIFAEFLEEAGTSLKLPPLSQLSQRYAALGRRWSELADAALPDRVPAFKRGKSLLARKSELLMSGGTANEIRAVWEQLGEITEELKKTFPLSQAEGDELRRDLQSRVRDIYRDETKAHEELGNFIQETFATDFARTSRIAGPDPRHRR
jgi:hypothetical protein